MGEVTINGGLSVSRSNLSPSWRRQLQMFCCFLKCRDSENYFCFLVDIFSELVQTVQKPVRLSKLGKHLNNAQNTDPQSVDNADGLHKRNYLKWTTAT